MTTLLLAVSLRDEHDVVFARQRARQVAALLSFDGIEQARLATAVSEIARNAFLYAQGGRVTFEIEGAKAPQLLTIRVTDSGPGIAHLDEILAGRYTSKTGLGLGLVGTRRLVDVFEAASSPAGTVVSLKKLLPLRAPFLGAREIARLTTTLAEARPAGPLAEIHEQNQELLRTLDNLRQRQEDLEHVNHELEDTNRGVVALYAELDERADHLRRIDEVKTRFLSNMTHEFRTPLNSILALTTLLAERLNIDEQEKSEVYFIRRSALQLAELVDDLLDIAKVEAGKVEVHATIFEIRDLFGILRGMLRPLLINDSLALVFEDCEGLPPVCSDERKVSQILRNFISNALKYTERGEVRVRARLSADGDRVELAVSDTGIGIPAADIGRIFDEFVQIENPMQRRVKGTGLGLPLSKRLAELLGGTIAVETTLGQGSTFTVSLPLMPADLSLGLLPDPTRVPVLVVDDDDADLLMYERALAGTEYQVVPVRSIAAATKALESIQPAAIMLDIRLQGQDSWEFLARLKQRPLTARVPVVVVSSVDDRYKALALGADVYRSKPVEAGWLQATLAALVHPASRRVLVVDDQDASRFIMREILSGGDYEVYEAPDGTEGLQLARRVRPDVILLDLHLGDIDGVALRETLRQDPQTSRVPVIVVTSRVVSDAERERLGGETPVLSKAELTRERLCAEVARVTGDRAREVTR
jgi:signal transduction histidine kinase/CheY-like chemotaxis protein